MISRKLVDIRVDEVGRRSLFDQLWDLTPAVEIGGVNLRYYVSSEPWKL